MTKRKNGFTIIELLVALAVFSIIAVISVQIFVFTLKGQRENVATQKIQDDGRYILEIIFREMRMSEILSSDGFSNTLNIDHEHFGTVYYRFNNDKIERSLDGSTWYQLNSNDIDVSGEFYVLKSGVHPRASVFMTLKSVSGQAAGEKEMHFQTTISSRYYE